MICAGLVGVTRVRLNVSVSLSRESSARLVVARVVASSRTILRVWAQRIAAGERGGAFRPAVETVLAAEEGVCTDPGDRAAWPSSWLPFEVSLGGRATGRSTITDHVESCNRTTHHTASHRTVSHHTGSRCAALHRAASQHTASPRAPRAILDTDVHAA